jgi:hypothetical protein
MLCGLRNNTSVVRHITTLQWLQWIIFINLVGLLCFMTEEKTEAARVLSHVITTSIIDQHRSQKFMFDELLYTIQYAYTAQSLSFNVFPDMLRKRYESNPVLFESDLSAAPLIISRLERFAAELPESAYASVFAKKFLPSVKIFDQMLQSYAKER